MRLLPWIDADEVGEDGFWLWLGSILPLLPDPAAPIPTPVRLDGSAGAPDRSLARAMSACARERARLSVMCDSLEAENDRLARRLKALEAALRTFTMAGYPIRMPSDHSETA